VLGVVGGFGGGSVLGDDSGTHDPLALGVPLVNQPCSGRSVVVTTSGRSEAALASAVAEDPGHSHYLQVARSCATAWKQGARAHGYVVYLGPFGSVGQACRLRMTAAHRGDLVTRLVAGTSEPVQCLCYLDYTSMPTLRPGMEVGTRVGIYVRALQKVLETMGLDPDRHETGLYDEQTVAQVRRLQRLNGLAANGVVDASTWHTVLGKGCKLYRG
jgi:hypothetical protein